MKFQAPSFRHQRAFTLIELLVVIAIIAVLMALIMPSFRAIRHRTYKVKCVHNLRAFLTSSFLYAQDYRGWLPMGCRSAFCGWSGCGATCFNPNGGLPGNHISDGCCDNVNDFNKHTFNMLTNQYGLTRSVFYCAGKYAHLGGTIPPNDSSATHKMNTGDLWTGLQYWARRCPSECETYFPGYSLPLARDIRMISDTASNIADSPVVINCGRGNWAWDHGAQGGGVALIDGRVIWVKQSEWVGRGVTW